MPSSIMPYTWIEINKSALIHNLTSYKELIGNAILAPVIKGNAYGHGLIEIGMICNELAIVDWLCVFLLSEALQLRNAGNTKPILVMGIIDVDPYEALAKNIIFMLGNRAAIHELHELGIRNKYQFSIHLKVDTGLSRFGVFPDCVEETIAWISMLNGVRLEGIASHCSESQADDQTFTLHQIDQLHSLYERYKIHYHNNFFYHISNSAISGRYRNNSPMAVHRIGIGTYGYWSSPETQQAVLRQNPSFSLWPVLSWKTRIVEIKHVPENTPIGYNRTYTTTRPTICAILPVGYLNGYNPTLSNKGIVKIKNRYVPILGRVAMNTIVVDITEYKEDISIFDEVLLFGDDALINAVTLSVHTAFENPRFLLTSLNGNIPRCVTENALMPISSAQGQISHHNNQ